MKILIVWATLLCFFYGRTQGFSYPTSGNATGYSLVSNDNVTMVPSIASFGCIPTNGSSLSFGTSHVSTGAIYRGTSWKDSCLGSYEVITFNFSTGTNRPRGLSFKIFDVDNGSDSVSVEIFSAGERLHYTYLLFANSFITAHGTSPHRGFVGSNQNNSGKDDDRGTVQISTLNNSESIDSVIVYKYNGRNISGSPSQSFGAFQWSAMTALPLNITHFELTEQPSGLKADWYTQNATEFHTFQLQGSKDGKTYYELANLPSSSNMPGRKHSITISRTEYTPFLFFRIKGISLDGSSLYSKVIRRSFEPPVQIISIETSGQNLVLTTQSNKSTFLSTFIYDRQGRLMHTQKTGIHPGLQKVQIPATNLPKQAVYYVTMAFATGDVSNRSFWNH